MGVEKLEDAYNAGQKLSDCTLILTEGDSAKALAVAGLQVIGRDSYGVFPLRGKFINTRNIPLSKLEKNKEVKDLLKILNLVSSIVAYTFTLYDAKSRISCNVV